MNDSKTAPDRLREMVIRMRDDAAANGDFQGAAELDEKLREAFPRETIPGQRGSEWGGQG
jgi:hypothetical protein